MNRRHNEDRAERGQAFTLEGFIGAIIVLTAVLFALQAVVLTPTSGGAVDRTAQAQAEQEVTDALIVAENDGNLSEIVRYWDNSSEQFHNATYAVSNPETQPYYNNSRFAEETDFGEILNETFVEGKGNSYNVDLIAYDEDGNRERIRLVGMGGGSSSRAVSASYLVTLYDDQSLTAPSNSDNLPSAESDGYPIPSGDVGHGVYNVVEVRVTVW